jgi:hypothetical protein
MQRHRDAARGHLPGRLRAGEPAADHMHGLELPLELCLKLLASHGTKLRLSPPEDNDCDY